MGFISAPFGSNAKLCVKSALPLRWIFLAFRPWVWYHGSILGYILSSVAENGAWLFTANTARFPLYIGGYRRVASVCVGI